MKTKAGRVKLPVLKPRRGFNPPPVIKHMDKRKKVRHVNRSPEKEFQRDG